MDKKRTTGPKNDALKYIVEVDRKLKALTEGPVVPLSGITHLKQTRRGYVRIIEAAQDGIGDVR